MASLDQQPLHVRRKIALAIAIAFGVLLIGLMVLIYTHRKGVPKDTRAGSSLSDFYTTIVDIGQPSKSSK